MPITGALVGGGLNVVGGLLGGNSAKKAAKQQADAMARIESMYDKIQAPTVEEQKLMLDRFLYEGNYDPATLEALGLGPSAMEGVSADQSALDAQVQALQGMQEVAEGGLTEGDLAAARQLQRQADSSDMARRKSILNQMAQRGTLGSGMELAAQLQSTQDTAQSQADATDKLIQQAQARALEGLSRTGSLAEQMRYQSFNEGSQKASARDAINKFNVANRQDISNQNVSNQNQAQLRNLDARQGLNNANVGLGNTEQTHNKGLLQQNYENQLGLTNAKAGRATNTAQAQYGVGQARAAQTGAILGGLGSALGGALGAMGGGSSADKDLSSVMKKNPGIF